MSEIYDITIVGGGPVGLFAAFYGNMRQVKVKLIDSLPQLGGQPAILYPEKSILDVPGFTNLTGEELSNRLIEQVKRFDTPIFLNETVEDIRKEGDLFTITTSRQVHQSKAVIIAMGGGAFKPRALDIEGAEDFDNVHYHVSNIQQYEGQQVTVLGGGDSAVDWALALEPIAKKVSIIHRRPQFRAQEHSVKQLEESSVEILTPYLPEQIIGNGEKIQSVVLKHAKGEDQIEIPVDDFIVNYGFSSSIGGMKNWGFDVQRNCIVTNSQMETTLPGVFAVGDIATYDGKVKIIATGFGEAPVAINAAMTYVNPNSRPSTIHSSSMF